MMIGINEIWKDIKGYEGLYQVSNFGNVKRLSSYVAHNGIFGKTKQRIVKVKILVPIDLRGYKVLKLSKNGEEKRYYIHRLVAETFISNPLSKPEVNHKDGNKQNNCAENLEWVTHQENCKHRDDNKLRKAPKGEQHYLFGKHIKIGTFKNKEEIKEENNE